MLTFNQTTFIILYKKSQVKIYLHNRSSFIIIIINTISSSFIYGY